MAFDPADIDAVLEELGLSIDDVSGDLIAAISNQLAVAGHSLDSATEAELRTLADSALAAAYREHNLTDALETGAPAFVYLGPSKDKIIRPFCAVLVGKRIDTEDLELLDNGQGVPFETWCGGYNCRHGLFPIYEDQLADYPKANIEAANAAAEG